MDAYSLPCCLDLVPICHGKLVIALVYQCMYNCIVYDCVVVLVPVVSVDDVSVLLLRIPVVFDMCLIELVHF
jgi:hypothetical protein